MKIKLQEEGNDRDFSIGKRIFHLGTTTKDVKLGQYWTGLE